MRNSVLLLLFSIIGLVGCTHSKKEDPAPSFDQISADIMNATAPKIVGDWSLRKVYITYQSYNAGQHELKIKRDTVYQQFATLTIRRASKSSSSVPDARYPEFEGEIHYKTKTYPVRFRVMAAPNRVVENSGPQGIFLFEYNFPVGSHATEPEELFLWYQLSLIGENYSLEIPDNQTNNMIWRGSNRGVSQIDLVRQ